MAESVFSRGRTGGVATDDARVSVSFPSEEDGLDVATGCCREPLDAVALVDGGYCSSPSGRRGALLDADLSPVIWDGRLLEEVSGDRGFVVPVEVADWWISVSTSTLESESEISIALLLVLPGPGSSSMSDVVEMPVSLPGRLALEFFTTAPGSEPD